MKKFGVSFSDDVETNKFHLDQEAETAPSILQHYSELLSEARKAEDKTQAALKQVRAEKDLEVRKSDPKIYGLEKFTETSITSVVESSKQVVKAVAEYLEAKGEADTYESAVYAVRAKIDMIKVLTQLWIGGYYSAQ